MNKLFLAEERNRLGLKAKDVAEHAGVAVPTQSNYEQGKRFPDTQYLLKISELGFDLNFVVTGKRDNNHLSPKEAMLLELFRDAAKPVQKHILAGLLTDELAESTENIKGNVVTVGDSNSGRVAGRDIENY